MTILKIHGTSGAGKTTIVRNIMEHATQILPIGKVKRPEAYKLTIPNQEVPLFVLGPYENTCGGMDGVAEVGDQIDLIHRYASQGHVLYEGLLMSTYYGKIGQAMEQYGQDHIWAFLDTPEDLCIERIKARRLAAGNLKPLNETNTRMRMKPIRSLWNRLEKMGANVVMLKWDGQPHETVLELIYG